MDNTSAPQAAEQLGVSLSTLHALLDEAHVPRTGRGNRRPVPPSVIDRAREQIGAVPARVDGLSRSQMLILAALSRSPLGTSSARAAAGLAGVSPTVASRDLVGLENRGLVARVTRTVADESARRQTYWTFAAADPDLLRAVRRVRLPAGRSVDAGTARIPRRLYRHFWNADPASLRVGENGSYIATRLLGSSDVVAIDWALRHIRAGDIDVALSRRGVRPSARRLVQNWRADDT